MYQVEAASTGNKEKQPSHHHQPLPQDVFFRVLRCVSCHISTSVYPSFYHLAAATSPRERKQANTCGWGWGWRRGSCCAEMTSPDAGSDLTTSTWVEDPVVKRGVKVGFSHLPGVNRWRNICSKSHAHQIETEIKSIHVRRHFPNFTHVVLICFSPVSHWANLRFW